MALEKSVFTYYKIFLKNLKATEPLKHSSKELAL